jgi:hypothetical protein
MMDEEEERTLQIQSDPSGLAGTYANLALVTHSPYEFTLDFLRVDHGPVGQGKTGVLVSRVSMSPKFVRELIDTLEANWERFADKSAPSEGS